MFQNFNVIHDQSVKAILETKHTTGEYKLGAYDLNTSRKDYTCHLI